MKPTLRDVVTDAAALAGVGLIAYGAWLVYAPAGFIVAGAILLLGSWKAAVR